MYTFDMSKNVTFPANVAASTMSATTFTESGHRLQPLDGDLTAIAALTGTGYAKRTADNT